MSESLTELARRSADAYNRRDLPALREIYTEDAEVHTLLAGGTEGECYRGHEGLRRWLEENAETWEAISFEALEIREGREWVLVCGRLKGRGIASGVEIDAPAFLAARVRDGRIAYLRAHQEESAAEAECGISANA